MVVENGATLSAFAVITKLNGAPSFPNLAKNSRLNPDVSLGFKFAAPGMTNGIFSDRGRRSASRPEHPPPSAFGRLDQPLHKTHKTMILHPSGFVFSSRCKASNPEQ